MVWREGEERVRGEGRENVGREVDEMKRDVEGKGNNCRGSKRETARRREKRKEDLRDRV